VWIDKLRLYSDGVKPLSQLQESPMNELCRHSATELAAMIRKGVVSSREVVEAHLARIDEVNESINAVAVTLTDRALVAADAADSADAAARARPLHGVPFTIKENIDCAGTPTTQGVPAFAQAVASVDAPIVERMQAAGAVPIARTNLPELGSRLDTDNPLHGRTYNPWNRAVTPGGSSGGEAAAIATGMSPIGLGNDIGGSVRNPAYCCGIAAIKPTVGRVPLVTSMDPLDGGIAFEFESDGLLARTIEDLRTGLAIIAGRHPGDPKSVDVPLVGPPPKAMTAALVTSVPGVVLPDVIVREIERAGEMLAAQGWRVEPAQPPELENVVRMWGQVLTTDFSAEPLEAIASRSVVRLMSGFAEYFDHDRRTLDRLLTERRRLRRLWSAFFAEHIVCVGPTWTCRQWPIDSDLVPGTGVELMVDSLRFVAPGNGLGIPGVAVPTGVHDGLPTGVQIYADLFRDDLCLMAAECIERAAGMAIPIDPVV